MPRLANVTLDKLDDSVKNWLNALALEFRSVQPSQEERSLQFCSPVAIPWTLTRLQDQNTQTLNGALAFVPFILQQARPGLA